MMEKRNVAEKHRTPENELKRSDENWDKEAASEFKPVVDKKNIITIPIKEQTNGITGTK